MTIKTTKIVKLSKRSFTNFIKNLYMKQLL